MLKTYTVNNTKKMNNTMCPKKVTFWALKMTNFCQQYVKTTSKLFVISDVLFTEINHFQSSKPFSDLETFTYNVFLGKSNTMPHTVSYLKHCYLKHYLLERCCSFFKPMFQNFAFFAVRKQTSTCQNVSKKALLTRLSDDVTECQFWTG